MRFAHSDQTTCHFGGERDLSARTARPVNWVLGAMDIPAKIAWVFGVAWVFTVLGFMLFLQHMWQYNNEHKNRVLYLGMKNGQADLVPTLYWSIENRDWRVIEAVVCSAEDEFKSLESDFPDMSQYLTSDSPQQAVDASRDFKTSRGLSDCDGFYIEADGT